eukprot:898523-Prymnesium_polylepis.2
MSQCVSHTETLLRKSTERRKYAARQGRERRPSHRAPAKFLRAREQAALVHDSTAQDTIVSMASTLRPLSSRPTATRCMTSSPRPAPQ